MMMELDREEFKTLAALAKMFDILDMTMKVRNTHAGKRLVVTYSEVTYGNVGGRSFTHTQSVEEWFENPDQFREAIHEIIAGRSGC